MAEKIARLQEDIHKRISQKKLDLGAVSISDTIGVCLDLLEQIEIISKKADKYDGDDMQSMIQICALLNRQLK